MTVWVVVVVKMGKMTVEGLGMEEVEDNEVVISEWVMK